ncbi:hypothetical protein AVEN_96506-1 [Araneus ventricosus]|uniref:Uncharacterized protein n=1 Tax=Araneus ventricosus TaxID=182803 RepID=A0A4Y2CTU6_ARAVE|nr:hypothetical protein AVEN_96506-1 [Araneus ventricosus]
MYCSPTGFLFTEGFHFHRSDRFPLCLRDINGTARFLQMKIRQESLCILNLDSSIETKCPNLAVSINGIPGFTKDGLLSPLSWGRTYTTGSLELVLNTIIRDTPNHQGMSA